ncbi:hypothetical protein PRIPAC_89521 [Pristionchus pacificus]|uniref:Uncharacterized protein n=1 Tax=Pristionchus pacificus TaxID=54126 RepID=A0A454Y113_PRIPA|nr:hypothetical protein PRIPAC_89521 [Pristionchus pacificus]|eukprot:PDM83221.1 hypothetical protein PRIPAC_34853 [Pristionchus pacificus]
MSSSLSLFLLATISALLYVEAGRVGECRTTCIERNVQRIVRVHLRDNYVMVGACNNATDAQRAGGILAGEAPFKSIVTPYICNKKIGVWTIDELDEEGISKFPVRCPPVDQVSQERIDSCPK